MSLRDVERTMKVMEWFYRKGSVLFHLMDRRLQVEFEDKRMRQQQNLRPEESDVEEDCLNQVSGYHGVSPIIP